MYRHSNSDRQYLPHHRRVFRTRAHTILVSIVYVLFTIGPISLRGWTQQAVGIHIRISTEPTIMCQPTVATGATLDSQANMPCQGFDEQLSTSALDSPFMDLLALLEQAEPSPLDVPNSSDSPMGGDGVQGAEQAIDAQIKQLLALKQATRQQRRHNYLLLLQQAAAGLSNSPSPVSVGLSESMIALQAQDVNSQLALLQTQR